MAKTLDDYQQFYETNTCGTLEVLEKIGKKFRVRFVATGYETIAHIANVQAGKVLDPINKQQRLDAWNPHEEEFENNAGHKFVAFAKRGIKFKVKFHETGYVTEVYIENAKKGKVHDPYSKSCLGIGYLGEYDRSLPYWKQAKQLWNNVLKRCYNPKDLKGYYGRAFVDARWHCFANFLQDLSKLENFECWILGFKEGYTKFNLDKDLKIPGNNTYSREACMFISEHINKACNSRNNYGRGK